MVKKTFLLLKKNPLLIILPVLAIAVMVASEIPLMPAIDRIMGLSSNMNNLQSPPQMQLQAVMDIMSAALLMLIFALICCVAAVIFVSGYGNMLAAAANEGKATMKIFLYGIRKLIGKVALSFLLLLAIMIGVSVVISIFTTPMIFAEITKSGYSTASVMNTQKTMQIIVQIIMLFMYPFIIMWFPAIFMEREEGVTACFRRGIRAGVKNYLPLVVVVLIALLPTLCIYTFFDIYSMLESRLYLLIYVYDSIALPAISVYLFVRYGEMKAQVRNRSISV